MITRKDVDHICNLAHLGISEEEKEVITQELGSIIEYVHQIEAIEVPDDISDRQDVLNVMREDGDGYAGGLFSEDLISTAPETQDEYVKVPSIM